MSVTTGRRRATSSVFTKYRQSFDFGGRKVLNAGCGYAKFDAPNVVNLDMFEITLPDVVHDLSKPPSPFEDESFDLIIANHVLEHVEDWWTCFDDFSRILKPGGKLEIWLPGVGSDSVFGYRDHINVINHMSFSGTYQSIRNPTNAWEAESSGDYTALMHMKSQHMHLEPVWWVRAAPECVQEFMINHLRNIVYEIGLVFERMPRYVDQRPETVARFQKGGAK